MTLFAVQDLDFGYPGRQVGRGVTFSLAAGEVLCLLGPNGSGKTTLFKTLLGLLPLQGGRRLFEGEDMAGWSRRRSALAMAFVPQTQSSAFSYTVLQIVLMGRSAHVPLFATPAAHDHAVAASALATLGIAHLASRRYPELSGGERQLVLVARALAQQSRLIVMDEPTASLDFGNRLNVLEQIRRLSTAGITVILSTHDPEHAFQVASRVALLHRGGILAAGVPREVITSANMRQVYDAEVVVMPVSDGWRQHWVCLPGHCRTDAAD